MHETPIPAENTIKRQFVDASAKIPSPFITEKNEGLMTGLSLLFEVADDKIVPKLEVKYM